MQEYMAAFDAAMDTIKQVLMRVISPLGGFLDSVSGFWSGAALISVIFAVLLIYNAVRDRATVVELFKKPKNLAMCAMFIAINVIMGYFTVPVSAYLRIGFGFITAPAAAYMFGPIAGGTVALLSDVASYLLKPTGGFLLTYTLCTAIGGMISGMFFYKKRITFSRVLVYKLVKIIFVNIILNSIALAPTTGSGMAAILPARIIKNIILLPIQILLIYEVLKIIKEHIRQG